MKRLILWLLLLLTPLTGLAEALGYAGGGSDERIFRYVAPNGQSLYFTSAEEEPHILLQDVNFDGAEDVVVLRTLGASNAWYEFFLHTETGYVMARHTDPDGLPNYQLHPEAGLIFTSVSNGYAGALHEQALWRWNGTQLECIRRAESREHELWDFGSGQYTMTVSSNVLYMQVTLLDPESHEQQVAWEAFVHLDGEDGEERLQTLLDEEHAALWQGLE